VRANHSPRSSTFHRESLHRVEYLNATVLHAANTESILSILPMQSNKRTREEPTEEPAQDRLKRMCLQLTMRKAETFNRSCPHKNNTFLREVEKHLETGASSDPMQNPEWINKIVERIGQLSSPNAPAAATTAAAPLPPGAFVAPAEIKTEPAPAADAQLSSPAATTAAAPLPPGASVAPAEIKTEPAPAADAPPNETANVPKLHNQDAWTNAVAFHGSGISRKVIVDTLRALRSKGVLRPYVPNPNKVTEFVQQHDWTKHDEQKQIALLVEAYLASNLTAPLKAKVKKTKPSSPPPVGNTLQFSGNF